MTRTPARSDWKASRKPISRLSLEEAYHAAEPASGEGGFAIWCSCGYGQQLKAKLLLATTFAVEDDRDAVEQVAKSKSAAEPQGARQ